MTPLAVSTGPESSSSIRTVPLMKCDVSNKFLRMSGTRAPTLETGSVGTGPILAVRTGVLEPTFLMMSPVNKQRIFAVCCAWQIFLGLCSRKCLIVGIPVGHFRILAVSCVWGSSARSKWSGLLRAQALLGGRSE